jgi:hypothetical protein
MAQMCALCALGFPPAFVPRENGWGNGSNVRTMRTRFPAEGILRSGGLPRAGRSPVRLWWQVVKELRVLRGRLGALNPLIVQPSAYSAAPPLGEGNTE